MSVAPARRVRAHDVVVVGAGPAGLSAAACIRRRGLRALVLERTQHLAAPWHTHYEGIRLQSPRRMSHLPGLRIPRSAGTWVNGSGFLRYLQQYVDHHRIEIEFGTAAEHVVADAGGWRVETGSGPHLTVAVVVATGYNQVPRLPALPGLEQYGGRLLHSGAYRSPRDHVGEDVLVIGTGNSGGEIASQLANGAARRVRLAVRTPPHVVPRSVAGVPTLLAASLVEPLPPRVADRILALLNDPVVGDLSRYGLPRPQRGMFTQYLARGVTPIIDTGFLRALRNGRIEPVAAVAGFSVDAVELVDGSTLSPDTVIAATGYRRRLSTLVDVPGAVTGAELPAVHAGQLPSAPGLFFLGYTHPFSGNLRGLRGDAPALAAAVERYLRRGAPSRTATPAFERHGRTHPERVINA